MAAALLRKALNEAGLGSQQVSSAGVSAYNEMGASQFAIEVMREIGIDIRSHRSQLLTKGMVEEAGLVLVMTQSHRVVIEQEFGKIKTPIFLWREYMPANKEVSDPFGCDLAIYRTCRDSLAEAVTSWVKWIRKKS